VSHGDALEGVSDGRGHEVAMLCLTANDEAEGDDRVWLTLEKHLLHGHRDLKGTRHPVDGHAEVWGNLVDLIADGIQHAVDVFLVVKASDDRDVRSLLGGEGAGWNVVGHGFLKKG
jgi:hypothetical protein